MNVEIQPYFAEGERYPALIGVRVEGDEYETAYVSKSELVDALADNAKLRELVEMMYGCSKGPDCDDCKRLNDGYACAYIMRELGIEVDE